jgi:hypothetical protein
MMFLVVGFTSPTPKPTLKESSYPVKETDGRTGAEKIWLQAAQKHSEVSCAVFDELRRTLQYVEASLAERN